MDIDFDDFDVQVTTAKDDKSPVIEHETKDSLPPIETKKVIGSLMAPDEDSSDEES